MPATVKRYGLVKGSTKDQVQVEGGSGHNKSSNKTLGPNSALIEEKLRKEKEVLDKAIAMRNRPKHQVANMSAAEREKKLLEMQQDAELNDNNRLQRQLVGGRSGGGGTSVTSGKKSVNGESNTHSTSVGNGAGGTGVGVGVGGGSGEAYGGEDDDEENKSGKKGKFLTDMRKDVYTNESSMENRIERNKYYYQKVGDMDNGGNFMKK